MSVRSATFSCVMRRGSFVGRDWERTGYRTIRKNERVFSREREKRRELFSAMMMKRRSVPVARPRPDLARQPWGKRAENIVKPGFSFPTEKKHLSHDFSIQKICKKVWSAAKESFYVFTDRQFFKSFIGRNREISFPITQGARDKERMV